MTLKIKLPNPGDMDVESWFEQLELAIYHAKKSYQKVIGAVDENKREDVCLTINLHPVIEKFIMENEDKIEYPEAQDIELEISY